MLPLLWKICGVVGLISLISCLAVLCVCIWCFMLEPWLFDRRRRRETLAEMIGVREYSPPQRPYRTPRARPS